MPASLQPNNKKAIPKSQILRVTVPSDGFLLPIPNLT
jgi:hypothetical protein